MTQETDLRGVIRQIKALQEAINNPKILWEEVLIVVQKAQEAEAKAMIYLEEKELSATDPALVAEIFDTRERIWDDVRLIEKKAIEIQTKTFKNAKNPEKTAQEHTHKCGCHQGTCGCHHGEESACGHSHESCGCGCHHGDHSDVHNHESCECGCHHHEGGTCPNKK